MHYGVLISLVVVRGKVPEGLRDGARLTLEVRLHKQCIQLGFGIRGRISCFDIDRIEYAVSNSV